MTDKIWHLTVRPPLSLCDRVRLLVGVPLYVRFVSPDGECHAACYITFYLLRLAT